MEQEICNLLYRFGQLTHYDLVIAYADRSGPTLA